MKKHIIVLISLHIATASYAQTYTVERVIDGDTIVVTTPEGKSEEVQLIGIDTPESKPNDKAKRDSERTGKDLETINKMGQEATAYVKEILRSREIILKYDIEKRDKYGRLLAYVYVKDKNKQSWPQEAGPYFGDFDGEEYPLFLNATIIGAGMASPMTIPPNVKYADLFKELYEEAREQKRGLWADDIVITKEEAIKIADKTIKEHVNLPEDYTVKAELINDKYIITYPTKLPPGTRGADYHAQVTIDAKKGDVLQFLVGS